MVRLKQADQQAFDRARDLIESDNGQQLGFLRALFFGRLNLDQLIPYPTQDPADAQRTDDLLDRLEPFLRDQVDADQIDAEQRIPKRVIDGLAELGVLGMTVPHAYGGGGFSHTAYCRVLERISQTCASTAVLVGAHQSIGLKAIVLNGTEQQKQRWLPELTAGRSLAAFCLSEPEVGSDAASVQTHARLSPDGQHWLLTGEKRYATNAAIASVMTVMARTPLSDAEGKRKDGVTAFIVTPDMPGFEVVSPNRSKCGIRGSWQATLRFTDMPVPRQNVLGDIGRGLRVALTVLDYGRCTLSAGCVGAAKLALQLALDRAATRRQFNRPIAEFQLIKQKLARMAELTFAMDAMTYLTAGLVDRHEHDVMLETAAAKLYCSEVAWQVVDDALQIWAGEGYMREHSLERMLRDARINRIVEGTTEVMTSFIALMGMKNVGEQFEQTLKAARHPLSNARQLGAFARQEWRDVVVGHSRDRMLDQLHPALRREGRTLAHLTRRLARDVSRALATHREGIVEQQLVQQRLTWAALELYATTAVLSKLHARLADADAPSDAVAYDLLVGRRFCHGAAYRAHTQLDALFTDDASASMQLADAMLARHATSSSPAHKISPSTGV